MYVVGQYKPEIRLISNLKGVVGIYPDYESFLDNMDYSFIEMRIVTTFKDWPHRTTWLDFRRIDDPYEKFVARDKFGSVFSSNEIRHDFVKRRHLSRVTTDWYRTRHDFIYRETPVARTGKRTWTFSCWYKKPRTPRGDVDNRKCWKNKKIRRQWMKNIG